MKPARDQETVDKVRQRILEAALDIIVEKGFDALTMRALGQAIGMTAPNIYNYFPNKDALYISLIIKGFEMLSQDMQTAYHSSGDKMIRALAMVQAYLSFGLTKPRYYDIMFTLPTPKYNDYVGTPHEKLSEIEYRISMEIAHLALRAVTDILGEHVGKNILQRRVIQVWSLLHGMISLYNSRVVSYVVEDPKGIYEAILDEMVNLVSASFGQPVV